tara:strand:+ start:4372 stop:4743 length:372 start_codon:yes stop_codon:yes gene_type:complete
MAVIKTIDKVLVKAFLKNISDKTFTVVFWDKETYKIGEGESKFKIAIHNFPSKKKLLADPSIALGEAYMSGDIELIGNLQEIIESMLRNKTSFLNESKLLKMFENYGRNRKKNQYATSRSIMI